MELSVSQKNQPYDHIEVGTGKCMLGRLVMEAASSEQAYAKLKELVSNNNNNKN